MAANPKTRATDRRGSKPGQHRQPPFKPTVAQRRVVMASVASGIEQAAIATALNVSEDTLQRHFRKELDHGKEAATAVVAGAMFQMAANTQHKDCQRAGQFWLQAQAKWRTKDELVHSFGLGSSGDEGQPDEDNVKPAKITVEFVTSRPKGLPGAPPEDR